MKKILTESASGVGIVKKKSPKKTIRGAQACITERGSPPDMAGAVKLIDTSAIVHRLFDQEKLRTD